MLADISASDSKCWCVPAFWGASAMGTVIFVHGEEESMQALV